MPMKYWNWEKRKGSLTDLQASANPAPLKNDGRHGETNDNTHGSEFRRKSGVSIGICCEFVLHVI
jgi:hypothetical protein